MPRSTKPRSKVARRANDRQVGGTHYKDLTIQPWDVVDTWPLEQRIGFYRGNALKYLMRWRRKNGTQDLRKCIHYLEKLIEREEAGFYAP